MLVPFVSLKTQLQLVLKHRYFHCTNCRWIRFVFVVIVVVILNCILTTISSLGRIDSTWFDWVDREIGPFWGVLKQEGEQLFEEQPLSATEETKTAANALINPIEPSTINADEAADSGKKTVQNNNDNNDKDEPNPAAIGTMKIPMLQNK